MKRLPPCIFRHHLLTLLLLCISGAVFGVPAKRTASTITLPDGTSVQATLMGDEFFHYWKTSDGLRLKKNNDGTFSIMDEGEFLQKKGKAQSKHALRRRMHLPEDMTRSEAVGEGQARRAGANKTPSGTQRVLVLLVQFSDVKFAAANTKEAISLHINGNNYKGAGYGSARDYFIAQSDSIFQPEFDIYGPYTASHEMAYYGGNDREGNDKAAAQLIAETCRLANEDVDFSVYDTDRDGVVDFCYVIYAGYGEAQGGDDDTIWPHQWAIQWGTGSPLKLDGVIINEYACSSELKGASGTKLDGIGTICHEFGHCLGLPDFYPTDDSNNYGMSWWSIMDAGCYNEDGYTPAAYTAYERDFLGWKSLKTLYSEQKLTLLPLDKGGVGYKIESDYDPNEYIIIENIQQNGWNRAAYGHGMLVTHVQYDKTAWDENTVNNGNLERMTVIPADNSKSVRYATDLAGDLYPGPTINRELSNFSLPAMKTNSGLYFNKPLTDIKESDGVVYATFMEGAGTATLALDATDVTAYSFMAHWQTMEGVNEYTLEVYQIVGESSSDYSLSHLNNNGVLQQVIRADTNHQLVTNLEPSELYCYRVRCVSEGKASALSNPIFVRLTNYGDSLAIPNVGKPSDIGPSGFCISWPPVPEATSYIVEITSQTIDQRGQPDKSVLLKEDFSALRSAHGDVSRVMDIYTAAPDWRGDEVHAQAGYVLIGSKDNSGYLQTPYLPKDIGWYTVSFAVRKHNAGDGQPALFVLMGSDASTDYYVDQARINVSSTDWETYTFELGPVGTNTYLLFATSADGDDVPRVCLDNIKVTWTDGSGVKSAASEADGRECDFLGKNIPSASHPFFNSQDAFFNSQDAFFISQDAFFISQDAFFISQDALSPRRIATSDKRFIEVNDTFCRFEALITAAYTFRVRAVSGTVYSPYSASQTQEIINSYLEAGGIAFNVLDEKEHLLTVTSLNNQRKYEGHVCIPTEVEIEGISYRVAAIDDGAFFGCADLLSVVVPESVGMAGSSLFAGCRSLCSVDWYSPAAPSDDDFAGCNPQLLLFDFAGTCSGCSGACVIRDGHADELTVYLNYPFLNPRPFTVGHIQYSKDFSQRTYIGSASGWETLVLPFDVQRIENEGRGLVTPFGDESSDWHIWLGSFNGTSFEQASAIKAGVPYIVSCPNSEGYDPDRTIHGTLTFSADDVVVQPTVDVVPVEGPLFRFVSVYKKVYKSPARYVLNTYDYSKEGIYAGSEFQPDVMSLRTFGAFLEPRSASAPAAFRIGFRPTEEEKADDDADRLWEEDTYTPAGVLVRRAGEPCSDLPPGLYIQGGKKTVIR